MTGHDRKPDPEKTAREARRAEALRANLRRRKTQSRGRAGPSEPAPAPGDISESPIRDA